MKRLFSCVLLFALLSVFSFSSAQTIEIRDIVSILNSDELVRLNSMVDEYLVQHTGKTSFDIHFESLSYDELVQLKDRINLAIWNSDKWQEVTVPIGVWVVGEDIPVGHWTISVDKESNRDWVTIYYCDLLDESGKKPGNRFSANIYYSEYIGKPGYRDGKYPSSVDIDFKPGTYFFVEDGPVMFTPYSGKPDLGFK